MSKLFELFGISLCGINELYIPVELFSFLLKTEKIPQRRKLPPKTETTFQLFAFVVELSNRIINFFGCEENRLFGNFLETNQNDQLACVRSKTDDFWERKSPLIKALCVSSRKLFCLKSNKRTCWCVTKTLKKWPNLGSRSCFCWQRNCGFSEYTCNAGREKFCFATRNVSNLGKIRKKECLHSEAIIFDGKQRRSNHATL